MSDVKNIPRLRFPTFSDEWEKMRFSDFISYTKGFAFKSKDYQNDGVRIVRVSDLGYDSIKSSYGIYLDKSKVHSVEKYVIDEGDIIVTTVGSRPELIDSSVGRGILVRKNGEGLLNQNLVKINKCEKIKNTFLFGFFNTKEYFNYITQIQRGNANQSNITLKEFFNYQVSIPSLPEQQKIADFLTSVDKRIELLEKKKTLLETYKKGVMKKIFNQEIRFKDDNGNDFPDWEEKRLGSLLKHVSARNKSLNVELVLSVSNTLGFISQKEQFDKHRVASKDVSNYKIVCKNQFGYNPSRINVGSIALLKDYEIGIVSPMYVIFQTKERLDSTYMEYLTQTHLFSHYVKVGCSGSVRDSLNFDEMEKFKFNIPSLNEQLKISEFLTSIDNQIELLETQIDKSKTWKKGLLQKCLCR